MINRLVYQQFECHGYDKSWLVRFSLFGFEKLSFMSQLVCKLYWNGRPKLGNTSYQAFKFKYFIRYQKSTKKNRPISNWFDSICFVFFLIGMMLMGLDCSIVCTLWHWTYTPQCNNTTTFSFDMSKVLKCERVYVCVCVCLPTMDLWTK